MNLIRALVGVPDGTDGSPVVAVAVEPDEVVRSEVEVPRVVRSVRMRRRGVALEHFERRLAEAAAVGLFAVQSFSA